MTTLTLLTCLVMLQGSDAAGPEQPRARPAQDGREAGADSSLAGRFAELKRRFEDREKAFCDELVAANRLDEDARSGKIEDENRAFQKDWSAMADEVRALIRAHPDDPAAFEGIILLPSTMRSFLDPDLVQVVRDRFMDDPRMGRLCAPLAGRTEPWSVGILDDVAGGHPDRAVRAQATYALGMNWRYATEEMTAGRDRTEAEKAECLDRAGRHFTRVTTDFADVDSADGTFRLADRARAELVRIGNLPNLKVGKVAPEIVGEDLDGRPLKLSDHRGKVVVVCFWATWCGPCMAMVPHERELVARLEGKPFALLGVNSDEADDRETARAATAEKRMTWPSWWDGGFRGPIQTSYDVQHWPTVYVLDPDGVIRHIDVRGEELGRAVDALLAEMSRTPEAESPE
jgi:thiol-disulfide isomerase/thioredoxin